MQLAAYAAFGKGKGKGEVVRSHLLIEQRRQKLLDLKRKFKCLRCRGVGHWARDPECKFPGRQKPQGSQGKPPPKPTANVGWSDSSSDDGLVIAASAGSSKPVAIQGCSQSSPKE